MKMIHKGKEVFVHENVPIKGREVEFSPLFDVFSEYNGRIISGVGSTLEEALMFYDQQSPIG